MTRKLNFVMDERRIKGFSEVFSSRANFVANTKNQYPVRRRMEGLQKLRKPEGIRSEAWRISEVQSPTSEPD